MTVLVAVLVIGTLLFALVVAAWIDRPVNGFAPGDHDGNDSECMYWAGDFAGVNLRARCRVCR